jgi:hypothetical protein
MASWTPEEDKILLEKYKENLKKEFGNLRIYVWKPVQLTAQNKMP